MIEALRRVCELQPAYSPENTPAMQERGDLIRRAIPEAVRALEPELSPLLGQYGAEFRVGASDGIGRKTEAPWVRIFAQSMSPTPRDGFYVVVHFAADGSAAFVTVGCGSTIWANGELRAVSDEELTRRTEWARSVIVDRFGTIEPFTDAIDLGARAALPRTFEKATVFARRVAVADMEESHLHDLLRAATERLREIYEAQRTGRNLSPADALELQLTALSRPEQVALGGQGYGLSGEDRRAVELRAMAAARVWLETAGYAVEDTSATSPFDFAARRAGETIKVEVKGTTSDSADAIFMTKNEVELHKKELGNTALIIVSKIRLSREGAEVRGVGGELAVEIGWDVTKWEMVPLAYRLSRPSHPSSPLA